ncbi:HamA C-terminal domain-containing protein [Anaeromyxobacter diazotrophicus]|uniref:HamA C-terminal domain-containing protein n=1 Tax=Anaeromyxobacter diazotrophicus TaxID=2590199 RepID=UPI00159057FB|nr:DUF1837 domain-containing protein [Anaeromyxobacter diazotrophicus]
MPEVFPVGSASASAQFHYLKLDGNGQPKLAALAECLVDHLVNYALSAKRTAAADFAETRGARQRQHSRINREARRLLREYPTSGESGELLLYLILEVVLGAPQAVAKMELKTNPRVEVHGSDGIHMRYDETLDCLDVFFGESKLEQTVSGALRSAFQSIENFHDHAMAQHEFGLVTSNFKYMDEPLRQAVVRYLDGQQLQACRVNHALLIGYDSPDYATCVGNSFREAEQEFRRVYAERAPRCVELAIERLREFKYRHLRFEVFFMPFTTVEDFRAAFYRAVE